MGWAVQCRLYTEAMRRKVDILEVAVCHAWVHSQGLGLAACVSHNYPDRTAALLLAEAADAFWRDDQAARELQRASTDLRKLTCPAVEAIFEKYQNPLEADKLTKVQDDLDDVKEVVMQS